MIAYPQLSLEGVRVTLRIGRDTTAPTIRTRFLAFTLILGTS